MTKGVYVENLTEEPAESAVAVTSILQRGARNRHIGATSMNKESSRSHTVFTVTIQTKSSSDGLTKVKTSRLNLVDLAGSERQKAAQTEGQALKEASQINKSLSAIGNVSALILQHNPGLIVFVERRSSWPFPTSLPVAHDTCVQPSLLAPSIRTAFVY
jgi:kinesin family protein 15